MFCLCNVCCLILSLSAVRRIERLREAVAEMVLAVTHMHALAVRAPLVPPVSLSPTATSIMYSEGIIPPSLPLFLTHVHPHPSHHEGWIEWD